MMGAKVDGRIMPIDTVVKTGMIIEIITGNTKGPNLSLIHIFFSQTVAVLSLG